MTLTILRGLDDPAEQSPFLRLCGDPDRSLGRTALFLLLALILGGLAALLTGLVLTVGFAAGRSALDHRSLADSAGWFLDSARTPRTLISYVYELSVAGLSTFVAAATILLLAARMFRRPLGSFLTSAPRFRWRLVGGGFGLGLALVAIAFFAETLATGERVHVPILSPGEPFVGRLA